MPMLPSEQIELAIYRYVTAQGTERPTTITPLALSVGRDWSLVIEALKRLHSDGHIKLSKYMGDVDPSSEVAQAVRQAALKRGHANQRIPYSEQGNVLFREEDFFNKRDFIIEITPSGRPYFEKLAEEASAQWQKLGEKVLDKLDEQAGVTVTLSNLVTALPDLSAIPQTMRRAILDDLRRDSYVSYNMPEGPLTITDQGQRKVQLLRQQRSLGKQEVIMGDKYEIHGQAGAVGPQANVRDVNFVQLWNQTSQSLELNKLTQELTRLRETMRARATAPEHDVAIGTVASAEIEAQKGNGPQVLEHLSKAGRWALGLAREIGVQLAAEVIKRASGL